MKDAYSQPRKLQPGCEHFQGKCKCDTPYHLRASTPLELRQEELRSLSIQVHQAQTGLLKSLLTKSHELEAQLKALTGSK